jgi:hypothetical protein
MIPDNEVHIARAVAEGELSLPRVPEPADPNEVLREQLEYLIDHAERGACGCHACERYLRVRSILLEIFSEPQAARKLTATLPMAA